ncbi:hypothetical protein [Ottowia thiooxydans]|uniref:hypothetical protein n=1 Tax=Ottowia thiooxydans TaxID=219182 RepID=UPI00048BEC61|nr:hypothetical protein [Ottowia thiooxydans]
MKPISFLALLCIVTALFLPAMAHADDGHGHGGAAPSASGPSLPRFAAVSDVFELVGVLDGKRITLWLDRAADNAPVVDARIELEIAGEKLKAEPHEDVYEVVLAAEPKPGVLPITAMVVAGSETDLLAAELDLHEDSHADAAAPARPWSRYAPWAAGLAALLVLVVFTRRMSASRQRRAGDAA